MCDPVTVVTAGEALFGAEAAAATYGTFEAMAGLEAAAGWAAAGEAAATYGTFEGMTGAGSLGEAVGEVASAAGWASEAGTMGDWVGATAADQGLTWFDKASSALSSLGNGTKSVAGSLQTPMSLYSGYKALTAADEMKRRAAMLSKTSDPWGLSGGRDAAIKQLQDLNSNPSAAMASDPRYAAMVQAAQRATAIHGQDSGAMAVAGAQAGGNWYTQRMQELSGLAGATTNPATSSAIEMQGLASANELASRGLASIGYGVQRLNGSPMPPEVLAWMRSQGVA